MWTHTSAGIASIVSRASRACMRLTMRSAAVTPSLASAIAALLRGPVKATAASASSAPSANHPAVDNRILNVFDMFECI